LFALTWVAFNNIYQNKYCVQDDLFSKNEKKNNWKKLN